MIVVTDFLLLMKSFPFHNRKENRFPFNYEKQKLFIIKRKTVFFHLWKVFLFTIKGKTVFLSVMKSFSFSQSKGKLSPRSHSFQFERNHKTISPSVFIFYTVIFIIWEGWGGEANLTHCDPSEINHNKSSATTYPCRNTCGWNIYVLDTCVYNT